MKGSGVPSRALRRAGLFHDPLPVLEAAGHAGRVSFAAGDEAGDAVPPRGHGRVAVAQVEAPANMVGGVGEGAVKGFVLDEKDSADFQRAENAFARRQPVFGQALEVAGRTQTGREPGSDPDRVSRLAQFTISFGRFAFNHKRPAPLKGASRQKLASGPPFQWISIPSRLENR